MGTFFTNGPANDGRSGRKVKATFMLGVLVFMLAASLLGPKPVKAIPAEDVVTETQTTVVNVWTQIKDAFVEAAVTAVVNGVNYFASQMAYTLAVALTSDCPGQVVCWNSKAFEDGFKQAWQGAIGEAIGTLSEQGGFTKLGFDLCNPGINFSLKIQLGALDEIKPPPPKCDFNKVTSNWENFRDSVSSGEVLQGLKPTFERGQSGLSVALGAQDGLYSVKEEAKRADIMKRIMDASAGGGFSDVRDPVSGRAKAPSSVVHEQFQQMRKDQERGIDNAATIGAGQIASKAVISVVVNAVQTFAMTLISRLLNKLINGLMSTEELIALQPDLILNPEGLLNPPGTTGATEALASRFSAAQPRETGLVDPLLEFSVCPGHNRAPNNCVVDQQFANAIRLGDATPLTVQDAIDKNMLHGDWPLYSTDNVIKDQDPFCYTYGYCESNLKKMRAARILSIGWEIAAHKAGATTKLREIVAGFHDCNDLGEGDAAHRWCHLIDPDWVLKIPPTQCRAMAFGAVPISNDIASRAEQCVDTLTCLKQDDSGTCVGGWGYCARERNAWRFNGDSCPAAYNTCRTLKSRTGDIKNFILNTIDHGVCNADNAGCRQYSLDLSTVKCSLSPSDYPGGICTHPTGPTDPIKNCACTVNTGTCQIARDKTSCTAANGEVCRQAYPCSSSSCSCTTSMSCTVAKDQRTCSSLTGLSTTGDDWQLDPSRFFNKNVQTCAASSNGCSGLVQYKAGEALNLVKNSSFEDTEDGDNDGSPDHARSWTPFADQPADTVGSLTKNGSRSSSGQNGVLLPYIAGFNPPSTIGSTAVCTLAGLNTPEPRWIENGICKTDLGCWCKYSGGPLNDYSCKVAKGHTTCTVAQAVMQDGLPITKSDSYTVSATFIPPSGNTVNGAIGLSFRDVTGTAVSLSGGQVVSTISIAGGQASCQGGSSPPGTACTSNSDCSGGGTCPVSCAVSGGDIVFTVNGTKLDDEKGLRAYCTFVVEADVAHASLWLYTPVNSDYWADDVQFEEGGGSGYHEGYGVADVQNAVPLKVPPAFLGCTGALDDREECKSFAGVCQETEVGCDLFTPMNGDPAVPGIAGPQDLCPEECAGYDVFKQDASDFDTEKFPVYFIPESAKLCTENEVGCSEFTNVETEQIEYYSRLRLCIKPDDATKGVYYSWEGSDTTGYQLLVWNLKNTNGPVDSVPPTPELGARAANDVCAVAGGCTVSDEYAGPAPCTSLDAAATACDSKTQSNPSGETDGLCTRNDIDSGDFDCREFYDSKGNRHYRKLSKTIIASAECSQYRITTSTQPDCEHSNGRWQADKGQCIYFTDAKESRSCGKNENNCRAYKGNASTNIRPVFSEDFEAWPGEWIDSDDISSGIDARSPISQSGESVTVGGHSLKIGTGGGGREAHREVGGLVAPGRSYSINFWARGVGTLNVGFKDGAAPVTCTLEEACPVDAGPNGCPCNTDTGLSCNVGASGTTCNITGAGTCHSSVPADNGTGCTLLSQVSCFNGGGTCTFATPTPVKPRSLQFSDDDEATALPHTSAPKITLTSEWKQYTLGPIFVDAPSDPNSSPWGRTSVKLSFQAVGASDIFVDNVDLKEVQDNIFVVRDSWVTPASCDQTAEGVPSPQEMLGCKEYRISTGEKAFLRSFSRLCREQAVGCRAFSNVQNTPENFYEQSFNSVCRLVDEDGVTPRRCGSLHCPMTGGTECLSPGGCGCPRDGLSCTIPLHGTSCDIPIPADSGAACVCDYNLKSPAAQSSAPQLISDVCRVAIGDSECRFNLAQWDDSTRPDENPDRVNIHADKRLYLVNNGGNSCPAADIGCRAVGQPHMAFEEECNLPLTGSSILNGTCTNTSGCSCTLNQTTCQVREGEKTCKLSYELGIVDKWQATALKDDPSKYETSLCSVKTLNCEEYTASDGTYYFRDPVDKVCQFKENVSVGGHTVSGFFRKSSTGSIFPCYPEFLKNGTFYAMYKNADAICTLQNVTTSAPYTPANPKITQGRCQDDGGCLCKVPQNPVPVCKVFKGNTTCGYQGWVGQCEAKYDRCEEFVDAASTSTAHPDGEPYYYIVNAKLDLKTCAGKASLKKGCVLFKQTSKTESIYSASATYYRSLTDANSGLVPPVNCNTDPRNSACEQRCYNIPKGYCSETSDKTCLNDTDDAVKGCPGASNHCLGKLRYGSGCNGGNHNLDCNVSLGEVCAVIGHCTNNVAKFCDADAACGADGPCIWPDLNSQSNSPKQKIPAAEVAVTRNDSNVIVKVRPDRECAQWLSCATFEQVFDAQQNKFRPRCTAFTLCEGTTSPAANSLECSSKVTPDKKIFGEQDYVKRDVTYSGLEYSGYTIPNRYPAQYLLPVPIVTGRCYNSGNPVNPYAGCKSSADCTGTDYCQQLQGICRGDQVGRSCSTSGPNVCGAGYCSTSFFDTRRFAALLDLTSTCATDADCDGLDSCNDAQKTQALNAAPPARPYPACTKTKFDQDGACVQHRCYYNYAAPGGPFNPLDQTMKAQCRAYPEDDAPYTDAVADKQQSIGINGSGFDDRTWQMIAKKAGYEGVNTCTYKNDCECSYKRLEYKGGGNTHFVSVSGGLLPHSGDALPVGQFGANESQYGVCSGGTRDGWTCTDEDDCRPSGDDAGNCNLLKKVSTVLGWPGFCIDPDRSISINGDPTQFNCNVWLPVDQLAGAPDSFNQFREAGFKPDMDNLLYCAVAQGNRHGQYYLLNDPAEGAFPTPCVSSGDCAALTGSGQTACENARNNVGDPWQNVGLAIPNQPGCWWDSGVCRERVKFSVGGFGPVDFKTNSDDGHPPWYTGFIEAIVGPWAPKSACEKVGIAVADALCTSATLVVVGANPVYASGPGVAVGAMCFAMFNAWCGASGFTACNSSGMGPSGGEFYYTSWQDATANYADLSGNGITKNQIIAGVIEFEANKTSAGLMTRMFMHNSNNYIADIRWPGNCDNGLCDLHSEGHAFAVSGNEGKCSDLLEMSANHQSLEGACEAIESIGNHNCVGARLEFDGSGNLQGLRTVLCHNDSTFWHRVSARLVLLFREACTEVIQTHDSGNDNLPNFAWTDRLWQAKQNGTPIPGVPGTYTMTIDPARGADPADVAPYGPITPSMGGDSLRQLAWPVPPYPPGGGPFWTALRFGGITDGHAPPCADSQDPDSGGYDPSASAIYKTYCDNGYTVVAGDPGFPAPPPNSMPPGNQLKKTAAGQSFACTGDCAGSNANLGSGAEAVAITALSKIFVSSWGKFEYTPGSAGEAYHQGPGEFAYDQRELNVTYLGQPHIVAPNTGVCDPGNEGLCAEFPWGGAPGSDGSFEISGVEGNSVFTTAAQHTSATGGRTTAYFKYYAWADGNHMPLRRKIVDFGDGSPASVTIGWFKNHRGCPSGAATCNTGAQQCTSTVSANWGLQFQACESRYFQEVHTYTCTPLDVSTLPVCNGRTYPCSDGTQCKFRPRIQFMDNWGTCNGSCPGGGSLAANLCFNGSHDLNLDPPTNDPNSGPGRNECLELRSDGATADNYRILLGTDTLQPWTNGSEIWLAP